MNTPTPSSMNRRAFLRATAATALTAPFLSAQPAGARKLRIGLIGAGWYGMVNVNAAFRAGGVEVVAVCDVDSEHLLKSADEITQKQGKPPATFKHYTELLALPDLDAVIIATPPHWHALPFLAALERGVDIYCEKPFAYDIREGRAMVDAAKKSGRVIQIGFQRRQSEAFRQAREYLQAGNAGKIVQVEAQINYTAGALDPNPQAPPASLDWDLWCGPAPKLPYSPQVGHKSWRLEKEYGNGHLVDWGIHLIDMIRWILDESTPQSVQTSGGLYRLGKNITTPDILTAHFDFETCPVTWRHRLWGAKEFRPEDSNGILFFGEKETVFATDNKWIVVPADPKAEHREVEIKSDAGTRHMDDFLACVRTREQPLVTPEDGYFSTLAVQLAMIAWHVDAKIHWDASAEKITGNDAASHLLRREYRGPWIHPATA